MYGSWKKRVEDGGLRRTENYFFRRFESREEQSCPAIVGAHLRSLLLLAFVDRHRGSMRGDTSKPVKVKVTGRGSSRLPHLQPDRRDSVTDVD